MLYILAIVLALAVLLIARRLRSPKGGHLPLSRGATKHPDLGWMSEQWLAEHRASHSR
jgi:hypothetical protein